MAIDSPPQNEHEKEAIAFCSNICFFQSLIIPATDRHDKLRVTFATTTNFFEEDAKDLPAAIVCLPMAASRIMVFDFDHMAKVNGVRLIFIDRPGMGGSTPVPLDQRVQVWVETIPVILKKLCVEHVALISHSAGGIYLFNTLVQLPQILNPRRPYAAALAPWVHPKHTSAKLMNVVDSLPQSWIGNFHNVQNFVRTNIGPAIQFSSGMLGSANSDVDNEECLRLHGFEKKTWDCINKLQGRWYGAEDFTGLSQEALLCMQKGGNFWDQYTELPLYIQHLLRIFSDDENLERKLKFRAVFSESDIMIGKGGQAYFEKCWRDGNGNGTIEFLSEMVEGSNHETVVLPGKGGIEGVLREIGGRS